MKSIEIKIKTDDKSKIQSIMNEIGEKICYGIDMANSDDYFFHFKIRDIEIEDLIQKTIKDLRNNGNQLSETYADGMTYASELLGMTID